MRRTKTIYTYNQDSIYVGIDTVTESWDSINSETPIWILPLNCTDVAPPAVDEAQILNWNGSAWVITDKPLPTPSPENTPQPSYDYTTSECVWDIDQWIINPSWDRVRMHRDWLLKESDWSVSIDATPKPSKEAWLEYRQALRDVPQNFDSPEDVVWPTKP